MDCGGDADGGEVGENWKRGGMINCEEDIR